MGRRLGAVVLLVSLAWGGCALGPSALRISTSQYNRAVRFTTDEQMLLNLVRLKYNESPLFLEIGSISAQFNFGAGVGASGTVFENVGPGNVPSVLGLSGSLSYSEKPTITYTPLRGADFVERLMSPLEIDTIMLLYYSGWSVERILRLTVQRINGAENATTASGPTPERAPIYERFAEAVKNLRELQKRGWLDIGYTSEFTELSETVDAARITGADILAAAEMGYRWTKVGEEQYVLTGSERAPILRISPNALGSEYLERVVDTLRLARRHFKFQRNGLAYIAAELGVEATTRHHAAVFTVEENKQLTQAKADDFDADAGVYKSIAARNK
ncbi:hypothetical protein IIC65_02665 [Candidatus Sumerlaeota bacterium]|nr:hypothetical protein [Candidatus Sumerlaeota bacterium]